MGTKNLNRLFFTLALMVLTGFSNFNLINKNFSLFSPSMAIAEDKEPYRPEKDQGGNSDEELNPNSQQAEVQGNTPNSPQGTLELGSFTLNLCPQVTTIPDLASIAFGDETSESIPADAYVTNVEYRLKIDDCGDPNLFYCGDYEIYLSSGPSHGGGERLVYNNLGGRTDGGHDSDPEDDSDIYLNWVSYSGFNMEDPGQKWWVVIKDTRSPNFGEVEYIYLRVSWEAPCSITVTNPNGGETWEAGSTHTIRWNSSGTNGEVWLRYSTNGGSSWNHIAYTNDDGSYSWTIPDDVDSDQCKVRVSDKNDHTCYDDSGVFTIVTPCEITVTSPSGGETWEAGSTHTIRWNSSGTSGEVWLRYSTNGGSSWIHIAYTTDDGSYSWTIPDDVDSDQCRVRVSDRNDHTCYDNSGLFTIVPPCEITVTSPNGGETWEPGSTHTIRWTSSGTSGNVRIQYTTGGIGSWINIVSSTADDGTYSWNIPSSINSDKCRIRVSDVNDYSGCYDISDDDFTIAPGCQITVNSPNGGETWEAGSTQTITWSSVNTSGNVRIEYSTNGGVMWLLVSGNTSDDGSHQWNVPGSINSTQCRVKISDVSNSTCNDQSNHQFTISTGASNPVLGVNPTTLDFGTTTTSLNFQISNQGGGTLKWQIFKDKAWIASVNPSSGINNATVTVTVDRTKLVGTSDTGTIFVSSNGGNQNITVNVGEGAKNLLVNGDFSNGTTAWNLIVIQPASASGSVQNSEYVVSINHAISTEPWRIRLGQSNLLIEYGKTYIVSFDAYAASPRNISPYLIRGSGEWPAYHPWQSIDITSTKKKYAYAFTMTEPTDPAAGFFIELGRSAADVFFDNMVIIEKTSPNQVINGDFTMGDAGWTLYVNEPRGASATGTVQNGEYWFSISNGGSDYWYIQLIQSYLFLENGKQYDVSFDAYAASPRGIYSSVSRHVGSYTLYGNRYFSIGTIKQTYNFSFIMNYSTDPAARISLDVGKSTADVFVDNIVLTEANSVSTASPSNLDKGQTNIPEAEQAAPTEYKLCQNHPLVSETKSAGTFSVRWDGRNETGQPVATGMYFYRFEAKPVEAGQPPFTEFKKMILMK